MRLLHGIDAVDIRSLYFRVLDLEDGGLSDFFLERFTPEEIAYCIGEHEGSAARTESLAACFAAKEAVAKMMRVGFDRVSPTEIEVRHEDCGAPYVRLSGHAAQEAEKLGLTSADIVLTLTHTEIIAIASAMACIRDAAKTKQGG